MAAPNPTVKKDSNNSLTRSKGRKRSFSEYVTAGEYPTSNSSSNGDITGYSAAAKRAKISYASEMDIDTLPNNMNHGFKVVQHSPPVMPRVYLSSPEKEEDSIWENSYYLCSSKATQNPCWLGSPPSMDNDTHNTNHHGRKNVGTIDTCDDALLVNHRPLNDPPSPLSHAVTAAQPSQHCEQKKQHRLSSPYLTTKNCDESNKMASTLGSDINFISVPRPKKHHKNTVSPRIYMMIQTILIISVVVCASYFYYRWNLQKQLFFDQSNAFLFHQKKYEQQISALIAKLEDQSRKSLELELHQKKKIDALSSQLEDQTKNCMELDLHHKQLIASLVTQLEDQSKSSMESLNAVVLAQAEQKLIEEQQWKQDCEALLEICQENAMHAIQAVVDEVLLDGQHKKPPSVLFEQMGNTEDNKEKTWQQVEEQWIDKNRKDHDNLIMTVEEYVGKEVVRNFKTYVPDSIPGTSENFKEAVDEDGDSLPAFELNDKNENFSISKSILEFEKENKKSVHEGANQSLDVLVLSQLIDIDNHHETNSIVINTEKLSSYNGITLSSLAEEINTVDENEDKNCEGLGQEGEEVETGVFNDEYLDEEQFEDEEELKDEEWFEDDNEFEGV